MSQDKKFTKPERSWIMYDWANSVYATIVMAAVFPIYFTMMVPDGDKWWGYGTSIATFTIAILAPLLGAIADYKGMKKKFLIFFLAVGVLFTATMAIPGMPWQLLLVGYIFSYIGFSGSCLFYDSFLTDVTTHGRMDRVSATGYAMGYIGGSTIPFIISIVLIMLMDDQALAIQISLVMTSLWWALFSIPILKNVHQTHSLGELPKRFIGDTFRNVWQTLKDIFMRKGLLLFILAYFFYIDGVNTVIHMSTSYGTVLGLDTTGMVLALLVTQLVAAPFSMLFARISKKIGSIRMLTIAVIVYFVICTVGFYMGFSLEPSQFQSEAAYTQAFEGVTGAVTDAESDLYQLKADGMAILNQTTRAEDFQALLDSDAYAGVDAGTKTALSAALKPVLEGMTTDGGYDAALRRSNIMFWCMAVLVGTCQGGIQALSRSYFGRLIPPERSNEYFGFFDIFGKFAAVIGPALYATIKTWTGRSSFGILSLMVLFIAGGLILIFGRKTITKEERAEQAD